MTAPEVSSGRLSRRSALLGSAAAGAALLRPAQGRTAQEALSGQLTVGCDESQVASIAALEAAAAEISAENPDVEIVIKPSPPDSFLIQMALQFATGRAPDVVMLSGTFLGELAAGGYVIPLEDRLAGWEGWPQIPEAFRQSLSWNGSVWGLPLQMDSHFVYFRRDIFAQAGLPADWSPSHPDDLLDAAIAVRDAVPGVMPFALYAGANAGLDTPGRGFVPLIAAYDGTFKDENGLWIVDSCAIRAALAFYERAYQIDRTVPEHVATDSNPVEAMRQAMLDGELALLHEGSWAYGEWLTEDPETTREQIGFAMMPSIDGESQAVLGSPANTLVINARSEQQELAWQFLEAANTRERQVELSIADPHVPSRLDAQEVLAAADDPFLQALIASADSLMLFEPDPGLREIIGIIQDGTGAVAVGRATPAEVLDHYASELARIFGEENVVFQPCNAIGAAAGGNELR